MSYQLVVTGNDVRTHPPPQYALPVAFLPARVRSSLSPRSNESETRSDGDDDDVSDDLSEYGRDGGSDDDCQVSLGVMRKGGTGTLVGSIGYFGSLGFAEEEVEVAEERRSPSSVEAVISEEECDDRVPATHYPLEISTDAHGGAAAVLPSGRVLADRGTSPGPARPARAAARRAARLSPGRSPTSEEGAREDPRPSREGASRRPGPAPTPLPCRCDRGPRGRNHYARFSNTPKPLASERSRGGTPVPAASLSPRGHRSRNHYLRF